MRECLGQDRRAAVCRELTKKFEEITRGTLGDLAEVFAQRDIKGEVVIVIDRGEVTLASPLEIETALMSAMQTRSTKEAAALVAEEYGLSKRDAYKMALQLEGRE